MYIFIYRYVNKQRERERKRNGMIKAAKLCRVLLNVKSAFKGYSWFGPQNAQTSPATSDRGLCFMPA